MGPMTRRSPRHRVRAAALVGAALLLAGCATTPPAGSTPAIPTTGTPSASVSATPSPTPDVPSPTASATPSAPVEPTASATPTPVATPLACPPSTGESRTRAPGKGKTVALTFDDGPGPQTLEVADALDAAGVVGTFFQTGQHASEHPEVTRELARRGHLVAGHSWDHRYPQQVKGGWTTRFVAEQMTRTATLLEETTGQPACFYRPPGGFLDGVPAAARRSGVEVVMWSVDSLDWKQPGTTTQAATARIVANATQAGDQRNPIVLFHDAKASGEPDSKVSPNRSNTVAALPEVIAWYQARGYAFGRLDGRS